MSGTVDVLLNTQQLALVDAHVAAGGAADRSGLANRAVAAADPTPSDDTHQVPASTAVKRHRKVVTEHELAPGTGKGVVVKAGQLLRVEQVLGGQCADFNVFSVENWHEHLHLGRTRSLHGKSPRDGDLVWSRAPWERPLLAILTDTGRTDTLFPYCSALLYWRFYGMRSHTNCQQMQTEAQREFGLPAYAVHESLNLFMYVDDQDGQGDPVIRRNPATSSDFIEFLAYRDVVAVVNVCGDDLDKTNNFELRPLRVVVLEGTDEDRELGATLLERDHSTGLLPQPYDVPVPDALAADPSYVPAFPHAPVVTETVTVELDAANHEKLTRLADHDLDGADLGTVLRDVLVSWTVEQPRVEQ